MIDLLIIAVTNVSPESLPQVAADSSTIQKILTIVFGIIGAIALLIITKSGFEYITSSGDPQKAATARSGIIYALIGLVVAITAQAIVVFVVKRLN